MPAEEAVDNHPPHPTRAIVLAGGALHTTPDGSGDALVIAADSGYDHARRLALHVDLLVGDMDSISADGLDHAMAAGVTIDRHPPDKDFTDLEIAIGAAVRMGAEVIDIHGGEDGRIAHLLGVALGLTATASLGATIVWHTRTGTIRAVTHRNPALIEGEPGALVSVIPVGDVSGVATTGLRWALNHDALTAGSTRGISNELTDASATVTVANGTLLVVEEGPHT